MKPEDIKNLIAESIKNFSQNDLTTNAINLFNTLGYNTIRQSPLDQPSYQSFKNYFITDDTKFNEDKALVSEWNYVNLLFQLTKEEVLKQTSLFDTKQVITKGETQSVIETYLFFIIELKGDSYTRSKLAEITREVNKLFPMPVMILFKYNNFLTLSIINRRLHKRDSSKDVLEKVTLIKDIRIPSHSLSQIVGQDEPEVTHRAHIEILYDLSFDKLYEQYQFKNFVDLHNAWQKTLDIKELNDEFYRMLFNWYLWALPQVKFPQIRNAEDMVDDKTHQSESLIRLITRLVFVWFMKEKGLINSALFDLNNLKNILNKFKGIDSSDTIYYRAILQNLFFATLNKPIEQRKIIDKGYNPKEYGDPLIYRFDELFKEPNNLLKHFENIPFLNGG